DIVDNIILAYEFAANDPYRAVTHNKGIMNGIIAVANSTGQDTRAIGAAGHAQNLSAIRALASEGIQKGHMKLHAQNIAASAGVPQEKMANVIAQMTREGNISITRAKEILENL